MTTGRDNAATQYAISSGRYGSSTSLDANHHSTVAAVSTSRSSGRRRLSRPQEKRPDLITGISAASSGLSVTSPFDGYKMTHESPKRSAHKHTRSLGGPSSTASEASPPPTADPSPALALASPEWPHISSSSLSSEASPTSPSRHRTSFPWGFSPSDLSAQQASSTSASTENRSRKRRSKQFDPALPLMAPDGEKSLLRLSEMTIQDETDSEATRKSHVKKPPPVSTTTAAKQSLFHPDLHLVEDAAGEGSRRVVERPSALPTQHGRHAHTMNPADARLAMERAKTFRDDMGGTLTKRRSIKRSQTEP